MAEVIYGNEIAAEVKAELKVKIDTLKEAGKRLPCLVVVLVGENPASISYVTGKEKACQAIGMENRLIRLPEATTQEELLEVVKGLNEDKLVDGILVQLPLPNHIDENEILFAIDPQKDVDGFHPFNIGKMMMGVDTFLPCTPKGIMVMLDKMGCTDLSGKKAVVIGRSNIVGKPVAQLLLKRNATVTIAHSRTADIEQICSEADVLIAAVGKPRIVKANWVKDGAVVIDVGVNRDENNKLCGDVDFAEVEPKCSYITPVPKGVGPMTIAMLLSNTFDAYALHEQ